MPIELNTQVVRKEGLLTAPADKDLVIVSLESNQYIALDEIGRRIWELLETPCQVDELSIQLTKEFSGSGDQITADVLEFLDELNKFGLIQIPDAHTE